MLLFQELTSFCDPLSSRLPGDKLWGEGGSSRLPGDKLWGEGGPGLRLGLSLVAGYEEVSVLTFVDVVDISSHPVARYVLLRTSTLVHASVRRRLIPPCRVASHDHLAIRIWNHVGISCHRFSEAKR